MALVNFTNLDFNDIRTSIKDYLRANSNFTDYDFEGSNLSIIIDALAYNTYIASYNANMITNEVFIDSATLRENVVSLARNIGYLPRSRTSSRSNVTFFVDTTGLQTNPKTLTLKKGTSFTTSSSFNQVSYSFSILDDITVPVVNGIATFENVEIYEGTYITTNFTINTFDPNQRFILDNPNIDYSTIRVSVRESEASTLSTKYVWEKDIFDINSESKVFFIQEIEDQRYELIFGDGIFGKKLENSNYIEVSYLVTNGENANGISNFSFSGRIFDNNENLVTNDISLVTTITPSRDGKEIESVQSIKKYSSKFYSAQNRAVTASDYEVIIPTIYPEAESVSVFGGEELDPPQYGKVFITIKPFDNEFISLTVKNNIKNSLKKYSIAGIVPEILDAKYLYVEYDSTVYYNSNLSQGVSEIKSIISNNILQYADSSELNRYGSRFKYSKFLKIIDDSHESITSNITKIKMRRDLRPILNSPAEYELCYGNEFYAKCETGYNIKSSGFTVNGLSGTIYLSDLPNPDGMTGSIFFFRLDSQSQASVIRRSVGTVDYVRGEIRLNPVVITSTLKNSGGVPIIQISVSPKSNDVIGLQDLYLQLDTENSVLNMLADPISSGSDISGSTYTSTSSYSNGSLVRQ